MITELDKIAFELYENVLLETLETSYNIEWFVEENILFEEWYKEYYDKAEIILRTYKINRIYEKSINSSRCAK